jgi:DNA-directed RNA polymerase subunit H (RpoH/RPB5)
MEDKALEILRTMLEARGLPTKTERIVAEELENVSAYTIGAILVVFSLKDKLQERDIIKYVTASGTLGYSNGLIIVAMNKPSENVVKSVKSYAKDRVQFFHLQQLQTDITKHRCAAPHAIFNEAFRSKNQALAKVYDDLKIEKPDEQLPSIDSQDAMVKWIGGVPGDIVYVNRHSDVAGHTDYWRYVVEDVNVVTTATADA